MAESPGKHSPQWYEAIRRRATELYRRSGGVPGRDEENWLRAEAEILRESGEADDVGAASRRRAIVVNVQGVVYTGEYQSNSAEGYTPGEWRAGDPVPVRISGDKLFLMRPNGRELQTSIVKRIG